LEVIDIWIRILELLKDSSTLRDTAFFHCEATVSEKMIGSSWKCYHRSIAGQGSLSLLNFGIHQDPDFGLASPWQRSACTKRSRLVFSLYRQLHSTTRIADNYM